MSNKIKPIIGIVTESFDYTYKAAFLFVKKSAKIVKPFQIYFLFDLLSQKKNWLIIYWLIVQYIIKKLIAYKNIYKNINWKKSIYKYLWTKHAFISINNEKYLKFKKKTLFLFAWKWD